MHLRRRLKHFLGLALFRSGLYRRLLRRAAIVAVFHRVDDRYPDNPVTCTSQDFAEYCDFFARYFTVVSLSDLVRRLAENRDVAGMLAITFDDGYLDNREVAAPILKERRLPATFFVATDFIGSSQVPWWDAEAEIPSRWMSWEDVRHLAADGFEIGSHTVHHADLGKVRGDEAFRELSDSKRRLETELHRDVTLFAYPYGGRDHLDEANRPLVREVGYACCVSAFGGSVPSGTDPFRMRRTPVSPWYLTPYQFGFETVLVHARHDGHDG